MDTVTMDTVSMHAVSMDPVTTDTVTTTDPDVAGESYFLTMIQIVIAVLGIVTNLIVIIVFSKDKNLRKKIPNICIINQVSRLVLSMADPRFPRGGCTNPRVSASNFNVAKFCRKLHGKERNWTEERGSHAFPASPLEPPMFLSNISMLQKWIVYLLRSRIYINRHRKFSTLLKLLFTVNKITESSLHAFRDTSFFSNSRS